MVNDPAALDGVFGALADPIRRRIVERLAQGELTAGALAAGFPVSQPAISKHLKVLERSGLLERSVVGREHRCRLAPQAMQGAAAWLDTQQRFWSEAFDRLDDYLAHPPSEGATTR
jgi:DNA-binding transcriptional ArsR family regulator